LDARARRPARGSLDRSRFRPAELRALLRSISGTAAAVAAVAVTPRLTDLVAARVDDQLQVCLEDGRTAVAANHVVLQQQRAGSAVLAAGEDDAGPLRRRRLVRVSHDRVAADLELRRDHGRAFVRLELEQDAGPGVVLDRVPNDVNVELWTVARVRLDVDAGSGLAGRCVAHALERAAPDVQAAHSCAPARASWGAARGRVAHRDV